ncbi:hypothetical protein NC651_011531 [Populus alba x Populus x berolinensis]|nr:hypothetical protein NC651_011531 [Populus alba x Populus x berolinensis]
MVSKKIRIRDRTGFQVGFLHACLFLWSSQQLKLAHLISCLSVSITILKTKSCALASMVHLGVLV